MSNHPITPPTELVEQWLSSHDFLWGPLEQRSITSNRLQNVATRAAQWGADQEMEACITWLDKYGLGRSGLDRLRIARRPEPPRSLKEQALKGFDDISQFALGELEGTSDYGEYKKIADTVRQALESL